MTANPSRNTPRTERGFTFIEVLMVMGIIAILAGLAVAALGIWQRKRPEFYTEVRINKLAGTANVFKTKFERLPPSDPSQIQKIAGGSLGIPRMPNSFNTGIESLFQCLYWPTFGNDPDLTDDDLGNTDEDELAKPPTS
ncbi:MAG: type II secretion system protein [Planctomycetota bacterium]|jgi:prepilin-type N-terminal cleavage/methylation domain-containing protein